MNRVESFITAHIGDKINECDDNFAIDFANYRFAVADGSSSDFFSNIYARLLVDTYVLKGDAIFNEEEIKDINNSWRNLVRQKLDDAGCKLGSFPYVRYQKRDPGCSTVIGLQILEKNGTLKYQCSGLGDSVLFFIPRGSKVPTIQFSSYSNELYTLDQTMAFGYVPIISNSYSTQWIANNKTLERELQTGVFLLMTDGLAEWILRQDNGKIEEKFDSLMNLHTQKDFLLYIENIRSKGAHNDDMTLMKVYIDSLTLSFDEATSNIYDYRKEAYMIEEEEFKNRQSAKSQMETELSSSSRTIISSPKSGTDKLIEAAMARISAQKSSSKEKNIDNKAIVLESKDPQINEQIVSPSEKITTKEEQDVDVLSSDSNLTECGDINKDEDTPMVSDEVVCNNEKKIINPEKKKDK